MNLKNTSPILHDVILLPPNLRRANRASTCTVRVGKRKTSARMKPFQSRMDAATAFAAGVPFEWSRPVFLFRCVKNSPGPEAVSPLPEPQVPIVEAEAGKEFGRSSAEDRLSPLRSWRISNDVRTRLDAKVAGCGSALSPGRRFRQHCHIENGLCRKKLSSATQRVFDQVRSYAQAYRRKRFKNLLECRKLFLSALSPICRLFHPGQALSTGQVRKHQLVSTSPIANRVRARFNVHHVFVLEASNTWTIAFTFLICPELVARLRP